MVKDIVIRESNWLGYLMWGVLLFSFFFVFNLLIKSFKLLRESSEVVAWLWLSVIRYAAVLALGGYLLCITWQETFNGFTRAEINSTDVVLIYMWPRESESISRLEVKAVNLEKWGKDGAVLQIITRSGAKVKSVSGDWNEMQHKQDSFKQALFAASPADLPPNTPSRDVLSELAFVMGALLLAFLVFLILAWGSLKLIQRLPEKKRKNTK